MGFHSLTDSRMQMTQKNAGKFCQNGSAAFVRLMQVLQQKQVVCSAGEKSEGFPRISSPSPVEENNIPSHHIHELQSEELEVQVIAAVRILQYVLISCNIGGRQKLLILLLRIYILDECCSSTRSAKFHGLSGLSPSLQPSKFENFISAEVFFQQKHSLPKMAP